jgi:hypothetical protein
MDLLMLEAAHSWMEIKFQLQLLVEAVTNNFGASVKLLMMEATKEGCNVTCQLKVCFLDKQSLKNKNNCHKKFKHFSICIN